MQKNSQKPIKWRLNTVPERLVPGWFGPEWRASLYQNPIPPLVVAIVLAYASGFKHMTPIIVLIVILSMFLYFDLLPLAEWLAIKRVNSDSRFTNEHKSKNPQLGSSEREALEVFRGRICRRTKNWFRTLLLLVVGMSCFALIAYVYGKGIQEMEEDVWEHVESDSATPSETSAPSAELTVRNRSGIDIALDSFDCTVRRLKLTKGMNFTDGHFGQQLNVPLKRGGDGQSLSCTPEQSISVTGMQLSTLCADIEWNVNYHIASRPKSVGTKSYRYILQVGHKNWKAVAIESSIDACKEY